jgi:hypothetical protein
MSTATARHIDHRTATTLPKPTQNPVNISDNCTVTMVFGIEIECNDRSPATQKQRDSRRHRGAFSR